MIIYSEKNRTESASRTPSSGSTKPFRIKSIECQILNQKKAPPQKRQRFSTSLIIPLRLLQLIFISIHQSFLNTGRDRLKLTKRTREFRLALRQRPKRRRILIHFCHRYFSHNFLIMSFRIHTHNHGTTGL